MRILLRAGARSCVTTYCNRTISRAPQKASFSHGLPRRADLSDPRLKELGKLIEDEYAIMRDNYGIILPLVNS